MYDLAIKHEIHHFVLYVGLRAAIAASRQKPDRPLHAQQVRQQHIALRYHITALSCVLSNTSLKQHGCLRALQARKRRGSKHQPAARRKQHKASARASPGSVRSSQGVHDGLDSEDDLPLGMLIGQQRSAVPPTDAPLQTPAEATPAQSDCAPPPTSGVAAEPHAAADGTATAASAAPVLHAVAHTPPGAEVAAKSNEHAHACADASASPGEAAGRQDACSVNIQPEPKGGLSFSDQARGLPDGAAAASCGAAEDAVAEVPAGGLASQVVPTASTAIETSDTATAGVVKYMEGQQQRDEGLSAPIPAASTLCEVDALSTPPDTSGGGPAVAATGCTHPQTTATAAKPAALLACTDPSLLADALSPASAADGVCAAEAVLLSERAPPAVGAAATITTDDSTACAAPCRASPELFVTSQEWQRLLGGAPQTDDVVVDQMTADEVAVGPLAASDGAAMYCDQRVGPACAENPPHSVTHVVPDSEGSNVEP